MGTVFWENVFCVKVYYYIFVKRRHDVPLLCSKVSNLALFRRSEYGTLASLKIILRALFLMYSIFSDSSRGMPGCQTGEAYSRCGRTKKV